MSKIKDENYYLISGWMINKLKLKGNTLNVYAIIYGFTQDGQTIFTGSRQYLCDFTGATKPTIDKALDELIEKNLIIKYTEKINNVIFNKYKVNLEILNFTSSKETLPPSKETLLGGSKETLYNNIYNKDNNNNIYNKKETEFDSILEHIDNLKLKASLIEFIKMRKTIKKPMTTHAFELLIKKLNKITNNIDRQIEMLENSILHGWQDVYDKQPTKQNSMSAIDNLFNKYNKGDDLVC